MVDKKGHIVLDNVTKIFPKLDVNTTMAVKDINLDVAPGEFVCIVGASGCGKSTMLRLISGLLKPTMGKVYFDNKEVTGPSQTRGFMFQQANLYPWRTVRQNVAFGLQLQNKYKGREQYVEELIDLVGLSEFRDAYPYQLSGGMEQRAALARALAGDPDALFLDEPLGALDAFTRANIQQQLIRIWQQRKCTMMLITHDVEEAVYLANRVIIMSPHPGRIEKEVIIDIPFPRDKNSKEFFDYRLKVLSALEFNLIEEVT